MHTFKENTMDREALIEEAFGLKGMIAEVRSKAVLWKHKAQAEQKQQAARGETEPGYEFLEEAEHAADQMEEDLAKYSQRLEEICEELEDVPEFP
jgi:hypothetical protein